MSSPLSILLELPHGRRGLALSVFSALARAVGIVLVAEAVVRAIIADGPLTTWIVLGVVGALVRGAGLWGDRSLGARLAAESKQRLRTGVLSSLLRRQGRPRVDAAVTVTRGIDDLDDYFTTVLPALSAAAAVPLVLLVRIVFSDVLSAVIIAACLPLVPLFMVLIGRFTAESTAETTTALERLSDHLAELAEGLPVLIGLGRAKDHARRLRELGETYHRANLATLRVAFLSSLALELIATISVALVAVVIGLRLVSGSMDLGSGLFVLLLAPECFIPLRELGAGYHASENGREARGRALELIGPETPAGAADPVPTDADPVPTDRVLYRTGTEVTWTGEINLAPGVTAVTGASGTGKSTVLAALTGTLPTGARTSAPPVSAAYVPQTPRMFATTIAGELELFGLDSAEWETALLSARLPLDPGTATSALSPGQLRRLALIRVLHRLGTGAEVLVLDEPTAHLDDENAAIVIDMIAEAAISHRVILASHDDRVRALSDSQIRPHRSSVGEAAEQAETAAAASGPAKRAGTPAHRTKRSAAAGGSSQEAGEAGTRTPRGGPIGRGDAPAEDEASGRVSLPETTVRRWSILRSTLPLFTRSMALSLLTACAASLAAIALTAVSAWLIVEASYQPPIMLLMVAIVGVRFFGLSRSVLLYVSRLTLHSAIFSALGRLRSKLWSHFERVGMSDRKMLTSDTALRAMVSDADDVRDLVPRTLFPPIAAGLVVLGVGITAAALEPSSLVWFALLGAANLLLLPLFVIRTEARSARTIRTLREAVLSLLTRALSAKDDLHANRVDTRVLDALAALEDRLDIAQRTSARNDGLALVWLQLSTLSTALAIALTSSAPTEILAVLVLMALGLNEVFASALGAFRQLPVLGHALDRLPAPAAAAAQSLGAESEAAEIARLDLTDITVGWDETPVLRDLDLHAERGTWTIVCGDSGTGKSTALSVVLRFLDPWAGDYVFADADDDVTDMLELEAAELAGRIAWCPQEAHIFRSTVRGNLALATPEPAGDEEMFAALRSAGLDEWADADGLRRWVGDHGTDVSGGQRQRLAVARTLLTGAEVIVLDEPTAHLDDGTSVRLMDDLRANLGARTVVMVTHDRRLITAEDEVIDLGRSDRSVALRSEHDLVPAGDRGA